METTSAVHRSVSPVRRPVAVSPQQHFKHTSPRDSKDMLRRLKRMARAAEVSYEHLPVRRRHTKLPPLASLSPYYSPPKAKTPVPPHFTVPLLSPMRSERGNMAPKPFLTKPTHLSYVEAINRDVDQVRDALRAKKNSLAYSVRFALQLTKYESSARLAICTDERSEANRLHRDFNQRRMVLTYVSTVRTPTPHQQMGDASMLEGNIIDAAGLHSLRVYRNTDCELKAAYGQTWRLPIVKAYGRSHYDHPLPPSTTMDVLPHMLSYEGRLAMIREARWRRRIEEDEQGEWECMLGAFESLAAIYEELSRITQMVRANEAKREAKLRKRQQEIFYQLLTQSIVDRERSHRRHAVETMYGGFVASASLAIRHSKAKVAAYDAESAARRQLTEREEPRAWSHIEALAHESRQHALELIHYRLQAIENVLEPEQRYRAHVVEDESRCVLRLGAASFVALRCLEQQQLAVQEAVARSKLDLSNSLERVIIEEHFHRFMLAIFENHAFVQHCEAQHRSQTLLDEWLAWRVVVTHSSIELLELERQAEYSMLMRLEALEFLLLESDLFRSEMEAYEAESRNDMERGATTAMEDLLALQAAQSFAVPPDLGAGADLCSGMFDAELGADALDALRDEMDLTPTDHDLQHLVIPAILDDTRQRTFFLMMNPPEGTVYADERVAVGYRLTVRASEATVAVLVKNRSAVDAINGASITMINKPDGVELLGSSKNLGTLEPREVKQYKIKVKSVALILAGWPVAVLRFSIPAAAPFNPNRATKKTSKHYSVALPLPIGFTTFVQVRIPADIKGFGEFWKNMGKPNRTQELFKCSLVGATLEHAMELFMERINQLMKFHTICPNPHTLCFSGTYLVAGAQTPVCMVFRCVGNEEATILGVKIEARSSDRALERLVVAQAVMLMKADANLATLAKEPSTTELTTVASAPSFARKSSSATIEAPAATSSTTVAVAAPSTSSSSQLMSTSSSKNKFAPEANKKKKKKVTVVTQPAVATTVTS